MENKGQLPLKKISGMKPSYLELEADMGSTKHAGSLKATRELIELCHIKRGRYVLDIGCGVGITSCYIAKKLGCKVVGVDISEKMIDWSNERAKREGVEDRVEFRVGDAQSLPFEDNLFDVVIGESIIVFVEDKRRAINEYVRVTKPRGYIGLNEVTWIRIPPPTELVEYYYRSTGAKPVTFDGWKEMLEGAGLRDMVARTYELSALSDSIDRIRRLGFTEFSRTLYRFLSLLITSSAGRRYIKETGVPPKNILDYLGYGIYVGKK